MAFERIEELFFDLLLRLLFVRYDAIVVHGQVFEGSPARVAKNTIRSPDLARLKAFALRSNDAERVLALLIFPVPAVLAVSSRASRVRPVAADPVLQATVRRAVDLSNGTSSAFNIERFMFAHGGIFIRLDVGLCLRECGL